MSGLSLRLVLSLHLLLVRVAQLYKYFFCLLSDGSPGGFQADPQEFSTIYFWTLHLGIEHENFAIIAPLKSFQVSAKLGGCCSPSTRST